MGGPDRGGRGVGGPGRGGKGVGGPWQGCGRSLAGEWEPLAGVWEIPGRGVGGPWQPACICQSLYHDKVGWVYTCSCLLLLGCSRSCAAVGTAAMLVFL